MSSEASPPTNRVETARITKASIFIILKGSVIILASELFGELWIWKDTEITGITDNSQRITNGFIFLCKKGGNADGADFLPEAEKKGAAAVITERPLETGLPVIYEKAVNIGELLNKLYLPKGRSFKLIGVTGTNGKTTVTHLIKDILKNTGVIGTNGVYLNGEKIEVYCSTPTTPKLCELYSIFAKLQWLGAEYIVMEVSSHALVLDRVEGCEFDVGVFTNLSHDHLDFHKTMKNYKNAKAKLFSMSKAGVINIDDTAGAEIFSGLKSEKLSVGMDYADLTASAISMRSDGSEFVLEYGGERVSARLGLCGKFNIYNALLAVGACLKLGLSLSEIGKALSSVNPVAGRMERLEADTDFDIFIDYAHSPDGLENVIHTVKGFARGRVITVFGCGGDRDSKKRPVMGEISGRYSDYTIITSDNPRYEDEFQIIADIYEGIKNTNGRYAIIPKREMAIEQAIFMAEKGDVIILAGKGAEDYQIIGKDKIKFDEKEIAADCIKRKGSKQCKGSA